ncbi:hypothetical protein [Pseudanabaena sp. FACHB-2040]|uniref:hypothetical protein n=1 Tax=Pseudanabaena sp. FACHB-2040 TaxID=2692859 RepID=UPI00168414CE|nr:hypothetical protein [Pseudanabaena sp. FACHB-2040]MBD2261232.1 hypothetical protein [Pseudanabaena sp. FACHB-2040]
MENNSAVPISSIDFPQITAKAKTGEEHFSQNSEPLPITTLDFWRWSSSGFLDNTTRGILAEFIVASALNLTSSLRVEWNAFDLITPEQVRIEVKSAAYLQSWQQKKVSTIRFSIASSYGWNADTNEISQIRKRSSDIYVFCLLIHKDKQTVNPLNMDQWIFYVLPTAQIDQQVPGQKTLSLSRMQQIGAVQASYETLAETVNTVAHRYNLSQYREKISG